MTESSHNQIALNDNQLITNYTADIESVVQGLFLTTGLFSRLSAEGFDAKEP
jgi:hypothetical protein